MHKAVVAISLVALLSACGHKRQPKSQFEGSDFGGMGGGGGGGGGPEGLQRDAIPPGLSWMCFRDFALADFSYCARSLESCDELRNTLIAQDQQAGKTSNLSPCGSQGASICHTYKRFKDGTMGYSCSMDLKDCEGSRKYYKKKADYGQVSVCESVGQ
ncbi:MAG: hypothetical protein ACXWUG_03775 [Polyangiales bacterium]